MVNEEDIDAVEFVLEREHSRTFRYKVSDEDRSDTFATTVYIEKDHLPDRRKPPRRIRLAIQYLD